MNKAPLFRMEALEASQGKWLGDILLVRPISFTIMTVIAAVISFSLLGLLVFGSYTKRMTVSGQLAPDSGVLKIFPPQPGIIITKSVREGQILKKGDLLYIISSERQSGPEDGIQAEISRQVAFRERSLRDELSQTQRLQRDQEQAMREKIAGLNAEGINVNHQLEGQRVRVKLAQVALERAENLREKGYVSAELTQQKQADLLDQQNRLQALERDRLNVRSQLQAEQNALFSLPLLHRNQLAQIERLLTSTTQEWTESEGKRRIAVTAPESGIATATTAEIGQTVDASRPMVSVLPTGAVLQAHLYAPSRSIGFIRTGDQVLLRYQAYPYQKFGHARGTVASVSRTAMSNSEIPTGAATPEALYRITVNLADQTITAYGKAQALQAGMLVDADVLQEKRQLYEWVLEPLLSMTGKL